MSPITVYFWTLPVEGFEVFNPVMFPDETSSIVKLRALWITADQCSGECTLSIGLFKSSLSVHCTPQGH